LDNNILVVAETIGYNNNPNKSIKLEGATIKCNSEQFNEINVYFLLDTGADTNIIKISTLKGNSIINEQY